MIKVYVTYFLNNKKLLLASVAFSCIFLISLIISYNSFLPDNFSVKKWLILAIFIAEGPFYGWYISFVKGTLIKSALFLIIVSIIPIFLFYQYFKHGTITSLFLGSAIWILEGFMFAVAAWI
jgi:uncharacterized membrane protein YobD (UPF0266 family)